MFQAIGGILGPGGTRVFAERMRILGMRAPDEALRAYAEGKRIPSKRFLEAAAQVLAIPSENLVRGRGWNNEEPHVHVSVYPLIGTFLLLGGRYSEIAGLELRDIDLGRSLVRIRPSDRRRVKTASSWRTVPIWPQLREIITPHIERREKEGANPGDLLFPSWHTGEMLTDIRKPFDQVARSAGWEPGEIRTKMFRHTYCASRLQCLDRGHPVSPYTVAKELGHGGDSLVKRVYGHLGSIRHRSEVVEYRLDQQSEVIPADRLQGLLRVA